MRTVTVESEVVYNCPWCRSSFGTRLWLRSHIKTCYERLSVQQDYEPFKLKFLKPRPIKWLK